MKLIRQISLHKLGGSHPTSWKPWENNWFPPEKKEFCQWTAFGFKLQCLFFRSSLGCLPSCMAAMQVLNLPATTITWTNSWKSMKSIFLPYFLLFLSLSWMDTYVFIYECVCVCVCVYVYAHTQPVDCLLIVSLENPNSLNIYSALIMSLINKCYTNISFNLYIIIHYETCTSTPSIL